jgi:RNA polymerase sigma-B factor
MPAQSSEVREQRTDQLLRELSQQIDDAQRRALIGEIVELNLGVCDAVANRYLHRGIERDDLVQVARLALIGAVERFRLDAERPFLSFAVPSITGEVKRYFRDHSWMVRPPRSIQERRFKITEVRRDLEQQLGRPPGIDELAAASHHDRAEVEECLYAGPSQRPLSLDAPMDGRTSEASFVDTMPTQDARIVSLPDRLSLHRALDVLSERDRAILHWRFVESRSQSEIGAALGVSQMQVSRLLRSILSRLRDEMDLEWAS